MRGRSHEIQLTGTGRNFFKFQNVIKKTQRTRHVSSVTKELECAAASCDAKVREMSPQVSQIWTEESQAASKANGHCSLTSE